jgi:hypothetical protein
LLEHALGDPYFTVRAAGMHQLGEMDIFDYLFRTSQPLGEGLLASAWQLPLRTTNGLLLVAAVSDGEANYSYRLLHVQKAAAVNWPCIPRWRPGVCGLDQLARGTGQDPPAARRAVVAPGGHPGSSGRRGRWATPPPALPLPAGNDAG